MAVEAVSAEPVSADISLQTVKFAGNWRHGPACARPFTRAKYPSLRYLHGFVQPTLRFGAGISYQGNEFLYGDRTVELFPDPHCRLTALNTDLMVGPHCQSPYGSSAPNEAAAVFRMRPGPDLDLTEERLCAAYRANFADVGRREVPCKDLLKDPEKAEYLELH